MPLQVLILILSRDLVNEVTLHTIEEKIRVLY